MADGHSLYQSPYRESGLGIGPVLSRPALLPFEKQLIKTLGISENEYRAFAAEVQRRGAVRPAEYALIPDIQCTGVETVAALKVGEFIALQIGLAIAGAAISYALTPKPKAPKGPDPVTRLELENIRGGNRFVASSGFDTTAELADYGQPIPIIFGLYVEGKTEEQSVGGMVVAPKLVWSRMSSQGRQQTAKLLFVVGEQGRAESATQDGIVRPSKDGLFLGNNALDPVHKSNYVFYWKSNTTKSGFTRIQAKNAIYGDTDNVGKFGFVDPNNGNGAEGADIFACPTSSVGATDKKGFSYAYTPANNAEFGLFAPIPNGSAFRVNFEIIPIPGLGDDDFQGKFDPGRRLRLQRLKIAGLVEPTTKDEKGRLVSLMSGAGRNYSRRMGAYRYKKVGQAYREATGAFTEHVTGVAVGDKIEFRIDKNQIPEDLYTKESEKSNITVNDINQDIQSQQIAADDAMQKGELFAMGSTVWQVVNRSINVYLGDDKPKTQIVELECIDTTFSASKTIGIVNKQKQFEPEEGFLRDGTASGGNVGVRADFYPLTRIAFASFRNNRPTEVVEIGIASTVFQRLNGLCNFQDLITPEDLKRYDKDNVAVSSGVINKYIERTSLFQIYVRPVGQEVFELLDVLFAVTGNTPVTMYNQIRIVQPLVAEKAAQYEYKIVPRGSGDLRTLPLNKEVFRLAAGRLDVQTKKPISAGRDAKGGKYGTFKITAEGEISTISHIRDNPEFFQNYKAEQEVDNSNSRPGTIELVEKIPDDPADDTFATSVLRKKNVANGSATKGRHAAFTYAAFGSADASKAPDGGVRTFTRYENIGNDRWILLEYTAHKYKLPSDHYATGNVDPATGQNVVHAWGIQQTEVVASSVGFSEARTTFTAKRGLNATGTDKDYKNNNGFLGTRPQDMTTPFDSSNPFSYNTGSDDFEFAGILYQVTNTQPTERNQGRFQGYLHEVLGSAQRKKVGNTFTSENITLTKGGKSIVIQIKATVFEPASPHWSGRTNLYGSVEYKVVKTGTTRGKWKENDEFSDTRSISYDNVFVRHLRSNSPSKVGAKFEVTSIKDGFKKIDDRSFDREFERFSQTNEVSFYGNLVTRSCDDGPEHRITYINEMSRNDIGVAEYNRMTIAGLTLKAGQNFTRLDQLRIWLGAGIPVKRLHPVLQDGSNAYGDTKGQEGPSNLFTDLVFHLLTDRTAGVGGTLRMSADNPSLIDEQSFENTSLFLRKNGLFCNGALSSKVNIREFIASNAATFLCNFVIKDGKFGLMPAVPTTAKGDISERPVQFKMYFNAGNILEDTFQLEYLTAEERRPFRAVVRYRQERRNKLPEERTVMVSIKSNQTDEDPIETFDLTQFCTSPHHAALVGKYFIGLRLLVGHTIQFSTTASGLNLAPGDYIKVETEASPYDPALTGAIESDGNVVSVTPISDGEYNVSYYKGDEGDVEEGTMEIADGKVDDSEFHDSLFTIKKKTNSAEIYIVEQLTFNEDMTVQISASEFRCDKQDQSELAILLNNDKKFVIEPKPPAT